MSGKERDALPDHHLILGDCLGPSGLSTLPDKSVGVTICDPPYSRHVHKNLGAEHRTDGTATREALTFEHVDEVSALAYAREICRVTSRWALLFCDERLINAWGAALETCGWLFVRTGWWLKTDGMPQLSGDRPAAATECIVIGHRAKDGRMRWNGGGRRGVWECAVERGERAHPAQKPLSLMQSLISDFTDPGELVCDPFAGSGTTLVACKRLGRRSIGWERDATFWERAVRRLENTKQQYELIPRGPKPKQLKLGGA